MTALYVALGAVASALLVAALARVAPRDAATEEAHKRSQAPIPLVGGPLALVALALGALACAADLPGARDLAMPPPIALGLALATLVGLVDDVRKARGFPWPLKLAGQALAASAVFWLAPAQLPCDAWLAFALFLVLQNAWNFFDNADACVLAAACAGLAASLAYSPASAHALPAALLALGLGALWHNRPSARVYLGDGGAHALAFALTWLGLTHARGALPATLALHGVVLLDLVQVLAVRLAIGWAPWRGDRRHLAHRLRGLLPPAGVALALGAANLALALAVFGAFGGRGS